MHRPFRAAPRSSTVVLPHTRPRPRPGCCCLGAPHVLPRQSGSMHTLAYLHAFVVSPANWPIRRASRGCKAHRTPQDALSSTSTSRTPTHLPTVLSPTPPRMRPWSRPTTVPEVSLRTCTGTAAKYVPYQRRATRAMHRWRQEDEEDELGQTRWFKRSVPTICRHASCRCLSCLLSTIMLIDGFVRSLVRSSFRSGTFGRYACPCLVLGTVPAGNRTSRMSTRQAYHARGP